MRGTVSLDGKPVSDCVVVFVDASGANASLGATAIVSNGEFSLEAGNGLPKGQFGILVSENQPDLEEYESRRSPSGQGGLLKIFIPAKMRYWQKRNMLMQTQPVPTVLLSRQK